MIESNQKKEGRWKYIDHLHYVFFLILNEGLLDRVDRPKQLTHLFKDMSDMIQKTAKQCRTHHYKIIQPFDKQVGNMKEHYVIYKFYYQNCKLRIITHDHFRQQIIAFLDQCRQNNRLTHESYQENLQKMDHNLQRLNLQENCLFFRNLQVKHQKNSTQQQTMIKEQKSKTKSSEQPSKCYLKSSESDKDIRKDLNNIDLYLDLV